jgi:hypothetical protein
MFPDTEHIPTKSTEENACLFVSSPISLNLAFPELRIRLGPSAVQGTAMPKATVDEYRQAPSRESDIKGPPL